MKSPTISVLMPVYNGEKFLREAIDSILNQTYRDFEFIIINDGSTDFSEEIILSYNDHRIIYVKNETNLKLIKTLNKGIDLAKGKYIARMDADDFSLPNRFENQIEVFFQNPIIDVVNIQTKLLTEYGKIGHKYKFSVGYEALKYINVFNCLVSHPTVMLKSDLLKHYRYRDAEIVYHIEDLDLWTRLLNDDHKIYTIEEPLVYYRIVNTGINKTHESLQFFNQLTLVHNFLIQQFPHLKISDDLLSYLIGNPEIKASWPLFNGMYDFFNAYSFEINKSKKEISKQCLSDLNYWKNYTLLKRGIILFKKGNLQTKYRVLYFLLTRVSFQFICKHIKKYLH